MSTHLKDFSGTPAEKHWSRVSINRHFKTKFPSIRTFVRISRLKLNCNLYAPDSNHLKVVLMLLGILLDIDIFDETFTSRTIYIKDGLRGFYRGYLASLFTYVPSSASWWTFYHLFQDAFWHLLPDNTNVSHTAVQCLAAMSSGCASSLLTNPLDLVRARVQVNRRPIPEIARQLWQQEGCNIFTKGLTARMSSPFCTGTLLTSKFYVHAILVICRCCYCS